MKSNEELLHHINREIEFAKAKNETRFTLSAPPSIPESLRKWRTLEELTLEYYGGTFPDLSEMKGLKKLILKASTISPELATLPYLESLEMHGWITGPLGQTLKALKQLKKLYIDELTVFPEQTHELPKEIGEMMSLKELILTGSKLADIPDISGLKELETLKIAHYVFPRVRGELSSSIGECVNLVDLRINKGLKDTPEWIGKLKKLKHLNLDETEIRTLPLGIAQCRDLEELSLTQNHLKTLPAEVLELPHLKKLDLLSNPLKALPKLDKPSALKDLKLYNTRIKVLPDDFINACPDLEKLDVGGTDLITLPSNLSELKDLKELKISSCSSMMQKPAVLEELKDTQIEADYMAYDPKHKEEEEYDEYDEYYDGNDAFPAKSGSEKSYWIHGFVVNKKQLILKVESIEWTEDYPYTTGHFWSLDRKNNELKEGESYQKETMQGDCGYRRYWFNNEMTGSPESPIALYEKTIKRFIYQAPYYKKDNRWKALPTKDISSLEKPELIHSPEPAVILQEKMGNKSLWEIKTNTNGKWSTQKVELPEGEEPIYWQTEKKWGHYIHPDSPKCLISPLKNLKREHDYSGIQQISVFALNSSQIFISFFSSEVVRGNMSGIICSEDGGKSWEFMTISQREIFHSFCHFKEAILIGTSDSKETERGKIYQLLPHQKALIPYVDMELSAEFLVKNGNELLSGGGYSHKIHVIEDQQVKGFYELDFKNRVANFEIQATRKKDKEFIFNLKDKTEKEIEKRALLFYETECWEEAADLYEQWYRKSKKSDHALKVAKAHEALKNYREAFEWYERFDPSHHDEKTLIKRAQISLDLFGEKKYHAFIKDLEKIKSEAIDLLLLKAQLSPKKAEKINAYESVLKRDAKNPVALKALGQLHLEEGDFRAAQKHLLLLNEIFPRDLKVLSDLFEISLALKHHEEALKWIERLCLIDFLNATWHEKKLTLMERLKKEKDVLKKEQEMIYDLEKHASTYSFAEGWLNQNGNFQHVENRLSEALKCFPESADFLMLMGYLKTLQNDHPEAESYLKKSLSIDPENATTLFHLGVNEHGKNNQLAEEYYRKAIEVGIKVPPMAFYNLAHLFEKEDPKKAIQLYTQAARRFALQFMYTAYNNRAYCFFKLKEYEQAERDVRHSLEFNPENAPAWLTLGAILNVDPKRKKEGEQCVQKALEWGATEKEILADEELGELRKVIKKK